MNRYIFYVFYIGCKYTGFQKQPNGLAIENNIELAFIKSNCIISFSKNNYKACSRTDKGANALCNVFTLDMEIEPNLNQINKMLPIDGSIIIWKYGRVGKNFNPRNSIYKIYKYILFHPSRFVKEQINELKQFIGIFDFYNFIKNDGAGEFSSICDVMSIHIDYYNDYISIIIKGDKFGREQIRRMIGFVLDPKFINLPITRVLSDKIEGIQINPVEAEFLILMEVVYNAEINWMDNKLNIKQIYKKGWNSIKFTNNVEYLKHLLINNLLNYFSFNEPN